VTIELVGPETSLAMSPSGRAGFARAAV